MGTNREIKGIMINRRFLCYVLSCLICASCINTDESFLNKIEYSLGKQNSDFDNDYRKRVVLSLIDSLLNYNHLEKDLTLHAETIKYGDSLTTTFGLAHRLDNRSGEFSGSVGLAIIGDSTAFRLYSANGFKTEPISYSNLGDTTPVDVMLFYGNSDTLFQRVKLVNP